MGISGIHGGGNDFHVQGPSFKDSPPGIPLSLADAGSMDIGVYQSGELLQNIGNLLQNFPNAFSQSNVSDFAKVLSALLSSIANSIGIAENGRGDDGTYTNYINEINSAQTNLMSCSTSADLKTIVGSLSTIGSSLLTTEKNSQNSAYQKPTLNQMARFDALISCLLPSMSSQTTLTPAITSLVNSIASLAGDEISKLATVNNENGTGNDYLNNAANLAMSLVNYLQKAEKGEATMTPGEISNINNGLEQILSAAYNT